jgi:Protein of unknown function (DUF3301)
MPGFEIIPVVVLAALGWFWLDSIRVREAAVQAARSACAAEHVMLLDDTVAITAVKPQRDDDGRVRLKRVYEFEYTDTGDNRRKGTLVLLGRRVLMFNVGLRDTHLPETLH